MDPTAQEPSAPLTEPLREALRRVVPRPEVSEAATYVRQLFARERVLGAEPRIGEYRLRTVLGQGGMGIVVRATDVGFGVDVALKVLDGQYDVESVDPSAREAWLAHVHHEANRLKEIRGEHVARVFTVGITDGLRWLAMELIEGVNLEVWLTGLPPSTPWRSIVDRFVDAAEGLASIHAAGIVHHDFKPRNAVLERKRHRVCVIDLGLALANAIEDHELLSATRGRTAGEDVTTAPGSRRAARGGSLRIAGTEIYMSPEQYNGESLDARSDQFSFCLALYWALYGRMPFDGDEPTAVQVAHASRASLPRRTPTRADAVPRWLHKVLERGLSARPEQRFPSMRAVIAELTRDRRRIVRLSAAIGGAVAATAVASLLLMPRLQAATCRANAEDVLAGFESRRAELATLLPPPAMTALEGFRARWEHHWNDACTDHFIRSEPGLALRQRCLDREWGEYQRVVDALVADPNALGRAQDIVHDLDEPAICDAAAYSTAVPPPSSPAQEQAESALADGRVALWTGDYEVATDHAVAALAAARKSAHAPTEALAGLLAGQIARERGLFEESLRALESASQAALAGRDSVTSIAIDHEIARLVIIDHKDLGMGRLVLAHAAGHLAELGWGAQPSCTTADEPTCFAHTRTWAEHQDLLGLLAFFQLDLEGAKASHDRAIQALSGVTDGDVRLELSRALHNRGCASLRLGQRDLADADFRRSTALTIELYGSTHPELAADAFNRALLASQAGNYDAAIIDAELAYAIFTGVEGKHSANAARVEALLGVIHLDLQHFAVARQHAESAVQIYSQPGIVAPPSALARAKQLLAAIAVENNELVDGERLYRDAALAFAHIAGLDSRCDEALAWLGAAHCALSSDIPRARQTLDEAARQLALAGGAESCEAGYELARTQAALAMQEGRRDEAIRLYRAALGDRKISAAIAADVRWALAQALPDDQRIEARTHAETARQSFVDRRLTTKAQEIEGWLAAHP